MNENNQEIVHSMLKTFFKGDEIYEYTDSVTKDYKEFKSDVIHHLKFLQKQCEKGLKDNDIMALNGINNYITSFLIRNHLIDVKNEDF